MSTTTTYDFCTTYDIDRQVVNIDESDFKKIITIPLNNNNVLSWRFSSFFMIEKSKTADVEIFGIYADDVNLYNQIYDYITQNSDKLCRKRISEKYIKDVLDDALYIFIAAYEDFAATGGDVCKVDAFRFLKELKSDIHYLHSFKTIHSILVCSSNISAIKKEDYIISPGYGALISYKSAQYAKNKGYQFYFLRAAYVGLIKVYSEWGFHFGLPYLNLDGIAKMFYDSEVLKREKYKSISDVDIKQLEEMLNDSVVNEVHDILKTNYRTAKIVLGVTKTEWEREKIDMGYDAYYIDAKIIGDYIAKPGDSFCMYMDVQLEDDMEVFKNYCLENLKEYVKY
jgi:hypothetical protein